MKKLLKFSVSFLAAPMLAILFSSTLVMADVPVVEIRIKDHKFIPAEVEVPSGKKIKLVIKNEDPTPEEFESYDLNREKVVTGNGKIFVFVGPLKPGEYSFFGEFNQDTAQGKLLVR